MTGVQAPAAVVMVRPHRFTPNPETAADNRFQSVAAADMAQAIAAAARLEAAGVRVHLFDDDGSRDTPDSVFPNNWFSTHPDGQVALYPMYSPSRRRERRGDIIDMLKREYRVRQVVDYSGLEQDQLYLEGTGAMVLDHVERVAYMACSNRASREVLARFAAQFNYEPFAFDSADAGGRPVYHTNVLMCVASRFALVGLELIPSPERRAQLRARLQRSGREVIALDHRQIGEFAGNALELGGSDGPLLALSARAEASLGPAQRAAIARSARLLPLAVPTIEMAGGSVRCMLAGIHLAPRR